MYPQSFESDEFTKIDKSDGEKKIDNLWIAKLGTYVMRLQFEGSYSIIENDNFFIQGVAGLGYSLFFGEVNYTPSLRGSTSYDLEDPSLEKRYYPIPVNIDLIIRGALKYFMLINVDLGISYTHVFNFAPELSNKLCIILGFGFGFPF
ncbi:unnamed protein product [marine sediment metagenome]|uniref:Uncharacterized protein n=1 Tax=marine sediment metagenome TaxID=412755 RepID=X1GGS5_9ZZZZ